MSNLRLLHYNNMHVHYYLTGHFKIKIIKNDVYTKVYLQLKAYLFLNQNICKS